jgi:hypothetical protein
MSECNNAIVRRIEIDIQYLSIIAAPVTCICFRLAGEL